MKFTEWFTRKLVVTAFPELDAIITSKYKYIINVSDEFSIACHETAMLRGIRYFWFPMNECVGDMGLNSLYGALQILWIAEQEEASVLLHCHAGANRSPTVKEAYYFLRTKKHLEQMPFDEEDDRRVCEFLGIDMPLPLERNRKNNRLIEKIRQGHLPAIAPMESFLSLCETQFKQKEGSRGGGLDWCKNKAKM